MKVYTRTGDGGSTQVFASEPLRMDKDDAVLECYGCLDELNCQIGLLACQANEFKAELEVCQQRLFQVGFAISAHTQLSQADVDELEMRIDALTEKLPVQNHFILPGGCQPASQAHLCRAVCRRAERNLVTVSRNYPVPGIVLAYVNRLSDYFFVLARALNHASGVMDVKV
ncbi:cob(I)yrinic acid a,c-diamide adenosyltransferase [Alteromonas aestuariivivens]|uniref:Corrinoid adenosyltransferase n=1 Tax=Alteromonas aestuariivivens TaxID=1938339 RepID=A0A3D8MB95_9ALTE|nr:cob(I)yrinic acid a,c-diamide adenosyltransferase [Alteromonas aestuariivivens]RDV27487.1 cob(I)yrinic acid a,c-diamide adenosyltransferase [Alteromonas aestuariivivens]